MLLGTVAIVAVLPAELPINIMDKRDTDGLVERFDSNLEVAKQTSVLIGRQDSNLGSGCRQE